MIRFRALLPLAVSLVIALAAVSMAAPGFQSAPVATRRAVATLITDRDSITQGGQVRVALRLRMADGWHTYWRNPGEAGVPVDLSVSLSEGATAGPIEWPAPGRVSEGTVTTYG